MFSQLDSRVSLLGEQLRPELRGAPRREMVREPSLTVLDSVPEEPLISTTQQLPCLLRGYDRDCQFAVDCDHTENSCVWRSVLAES